MRVGRVPERRQRRPLEAAARLLHRLDQALAGEVGTGRLQCLDEGVGLCHAVDAVVGQLALTAVFGPHLLPQLRPRVVGVLHTGEVLGGQRPVERARTLDRALGEPGQQRPDQRRVGTHVAVDPLRLVPDLHRGELAQRRVGRHREPDDQVGARGLQRADLRGDVVVGGRVPFGGHDLVVEVGAHPLLPVPAEVVVLQEQADLGVRVVLGDVLADDLRFDLVVALPTEGLRVLLRLVPHQRPGGDEQVRDLVVLEEVQHRAVGGGAEAAEHREDLVLQDQFVDHLAGLGRVVGVVPEDVVDLPAVDAAVRVDVLEVRLRAGGDVAVPGGRHTGQREVPADRDAVLGDTRLGRPARGLRAATRAAGRQHQGGRRRHRGQRRTAPPQSLVHLVPPCSFPRRRFRTDCHSRRMRPIAPEGATRMTTTSTTP